MEIRHILPPTDFSEHATRAVSAAFELAQTFGVALPLEALERDARRELARLLPAAEAAHMDVIRLVTWAYHIRKSWRRRRLSQWT